MLCVCPRQIKHFKAIHQASGIAYSDMIFFDNERINCVVSTMTTEEVWVQKPMARLSTLPVQTALATAAKAFLRCFKKKAIAACIAAPSRLLLQKC